MFILLLKKYPGGPIFVKVPEPFLPLKKDESIKIEVVVEGNPKPTINWILNGKEFTNKDGIQIVKDVATNTYSLTIPNISSSHAGTITCKATNIVSSVQHDFHIEVLG